MPAEHTEALAAWAWRDIEMDVSQGRTEWGGQGAMPPKPWIKKIKTHLSRYAYKRAHRKTAHKHSSFAPFQAYENTKKWFSFRGGGLRPLKWTPLGAQPQTPVIGSRSALAI